MLSRSVIEQAARDLHQAEIKREPVGQLSLQYPEITIEDAYAIQRCWVGMKLDEGRHVIGHKTGLTSRAMQRVSQIEEPDYGVLLDDMRLEDGSDIPVDRFIVPRIEVELAFILGKPLKGPNCTVFDVYKAADYVVPALELIDARSHSIDPDRLFWAVRLPVRFTRLLVDGEHAPNDIRSTLHQLHSIAPYQSQAVVRPAWKDIVQIKQ